MQAVTVSLQAIYHEARLFAEHFVPSILGLAALLITWNVARYFGRRYEQAEIKKHLPQIARDELKEREARIKELEKEAAALRERNNKMRVFIKFSVQRCRSVIEQSKLEDQMELDGWKR
jgi:hypothetical protein